jgi:hypothetical protein
MERLTFKSCQGFLVHVSSTYEEVKPYIHGLFLAENVWRANRDSNGYQILGRDNAPDKDASIDDDSFLDEEEALQLAGAIGDEKLLDLATPPDLSRSRLNDTDPPKLVLAVPRLQSDMDALEKIFAGATPIQVIERPVAGALAVAFGGGDALGEGFGSLISP